MTDLPQLQASFSIINSYKRRSSVESVAYEDLTGVRVDLETWDIDEHLRSEATAEFRRGMLRVLAHPSALLPYRPSRFLSAVWFARRDRCLNLGLFGAHQNAFEHKPWVETAVSELGLPQIPWTYIADEEQLRARDLLAQGPVMLRRSRTSGGEGIVRVETNQDLLAQWPHIDEAFVSVAPFLDGGLPVNVGATVWHDGVSVHHPSVQLIGIPNCVTRPFGYCGNDFGLARELPAEIVEQIEVSTIRIGRWMAQFGYLGTFGVDYLVHNGKALFTEINARFQGSTHASCRLSIEANESCLMLEHVAALLRMDAPK
ncbi:MAG TPA: ATP-grasp domain-containing protein, partial [Acidimicrobiales bacterium]|nr:ATP-grasp domain-containing protein [Acidimicrobiales bacterium]